MTGGTGQSSVAAIVRRSSASARLKLPSALAAATQAASSAGLASGASWRRRSRAPDTLALVSCWAGTGALQPSPSTARRVGERLVRGCGRSEREQRDDGARILADLRHLAVAGRDRLSRAGAQALAQEGEQYELAPRDAPVAPRRAPQIRARKRSRAACGCDFTAGTASSASVSTCWRASPSSCACSGAARSANPPSAKSIRSGSGRRSPAPRAPLWEATRAAAGRSRHGAPWDDPPRRASRLPERRRCLTTLPPPSSTATSSLRAVAPGAVVVALEARMHARNALSDRRMGRKGVPVPDGRREEHVARDARRRAANITVCAGSARIESSAPAMASGLRVNCTLAASARNSRSRDRAARIALAASVPGKPVKANAAPRNTAIGFPVPVRESCTPPPASIRASSFSERIPAARKTRRSPCSPIQVSPDSRAAARRLRAMSPFRMWLNSWPITPCSSSRESFSTVPRVTRIDRFVRRIAGHQGVHGVLAAHQVDRRNREAGGDCHFLDHVEQPALRGAAGAAVQLMRAQELGDELTALAELPPSVRRHRQDAGARDAGYRRGNLPRHLRRAVPIDVGERISKPAGRCVARDGERGGGEVPDDEPLRDPAAALLRFEEIQS